MAYESNAIFWIEVEKIVPNPFQPRREFDQKKLQELADSIRMYGVLQPLVVTRREIMRENGAFSTEYELIAGERRLRASRLAGLAQVPVIIRSGEETELMKLELAIIENLQREDLNAVDRALAFQQLADHFGLSHAQVAEKMGRSREYVSNSIRLLQLPETVLNALRVGDISDGHARTLLMLNDRPEEQDIVFREILLKKLSVREVERIARKIAVDKVRKPQWSNTDAELILIERAFTETLGTRVQISKTDFGGKLTIDYFSPDDLRRFLALLHSGDTSVLKSEEDQIMMAKLIQAVPLQEGGGGDAPMPDRSSYSVTQATDVVDTAPHTIEPQSAQIPEENIYTRFDSMETPQVSNEEIEREVYAHDVPPYVPPTNSFGTPATIQESTSPAPTIPLVNAQPIIPDVPPQVATPPVQTQPTEKEDPDLYSIRNFTL